jgi:hypothetical protein
MTTWSMIARERLAARLEERAGRLRHAVAVRGLANGTVYANTLYQSRDDGRWRHVADGTLAAKIDRVTE